MCAIIEIKENCLNNNYDYYFLCLVCVRRMGNPCPDGNHSKCDDRMANVASKLDNTTPCVRVYVSAGLARPRATQDQSADNWPKDERRNLDKYK